MKKLLALILTCIIALGATACGGKLIEDNDKRPSIFISLFNGGYGREWLDKIVNEYNAEKQENKYKITIRASKDEFHTILSQLQSGTAIYDMFITNSYMYKMIDANLVENISDVWDSTPAGSEKTIRQMMTGSENYAAGYGDGGAYIFEYLLLLDEKFKDADIGAMSGEEKLRFYADKAFIAAGERLYDAAESAAGTREQKKRVSLSRAQLEFCKLSAAYLAGAEDYPAMRRAFVEKLVAAGVKNYREGAAIPPVEKLDFTKSPLIFSQVDKTVSVSGAPCALQRAGDSTCPIYGFDFSFTAAYAEGVLKISLSVEDGEIFTRDNNIESWEQDCAEIYVSETCNRTSAMTAGDYKIRVNAHGVFDAFGAEEKVKSCKAEKTDAGYAVTLELFLAKREKIGFEINAHDFGADGIYKSTRYWNALKNADVFNAPYHYGLLKLED